MKKKKVFKIPRGPKVKIIHKLKKKVLKITIPKKGRPKGSKNKAKNVVVTPDIQVKIDEVDKAVEVTPPEPQESIKLPDFLRIVDGESYFASNKGRLTNQEIVDNGLEFACTTGNVWNYKFKK